MPFRSQKVDRPLRLAFQKAADRLVESDLILLEDGWIGQKAGGRRRTFEARRLKFWNEAEPSDNELRLREKDHGIKVQPDVPATSATG